MATKQPHKPDTPRDVGPGYEQRDVNIPGLFQFAFWMAVVLVVTMVGMNFTFKLFKKVEPLGPTASPMVKDTYRMLPPSPRLQVQPHLELKDYCDAQEQEVSSYGWVNQPSGVVRIPVDRAMDLILTRGLPARSASDVPATDASDVLAVPAVPGGADVEGQCGYLTEPALNMRTGESGEAKQ
jgi:hypothetical protein